MSKTLSHLLIGMIVSLLLLPHLVVAQNYPTRFLGFPIDGPRNIIDQNLKAKGFVYHLDEDYFTGLFYGEPVYIFINTRDSRLNRILLYDINQRNEKGIIKRFNEMYDRFKDNKNYSYMSGNTKKIADDEDVKANVSQYCRTYKIVYKQKRKSAADSIDIQQQALRHKKITNEEIDKMTKSYHQRLNRIHARALMRSVSTTDDRSMNQVWFTIVEKNGKYALALSFDNLHNFTQPED